MTSNPDLDAILQSIAARVAGDGVAAAPPPVAAVPKRPARLVPSPLVDAPGVTVEMLFSAVLEPLLRQWIDAHMPEICERVARAEIQRLTGQPRAGA